MTSVRARITKKGIDYANCVLHQSLLKDFKTLAISDCSGNDKRCEWEINSIENCESGIDHSKISLSPEVNGLTWCVDGVFLALKGRWRAKYRKGIIKASDHGGVRVTVKNVRLEITIRLGVDESGRPTVSLANCAAHINDVGVKFEGGAAFLYNIFTHFFERMIRNRLRDKVQSLLEKFINVDGAKVMGNIKVTVPIDKYFILDYGLFQAPNITSDFLETEHKGRILWKETNTEASLSPKTLTAIEDKDCMLYLQLSDYITNALGLLAHENKLIQYKSKVDQLPDKFKAAIFLFITEGQTNEDTVLEKVMEVQMTSTSPPSITISKENVVVDVRLKVDVTLEMLDTNLFTLDVKTSLPIQPLIVEERLTGELLKPEFQAEVMDAAFDVNPVLVNFMQGIFSVCLSERVTKILKKGIDLPVTGEVKFVNSSLQLSEGSIVLATDVQRVEKS